VEGVGPGAGVVVAVVIVVGVAGVVLEAGVDNMRQNHTAILEKCCSSVR
jgi:hypothetical protein